jgi:uncharacterized protein (DUF427 family)
VRGSAHCDPFELERAPTLFRFSSASAARVTGWKENVEAMTAKPMKLPGADHPITITPNPSRVRVSVGGRVIADTRAALALREGSYPPVQYIPRKDVDMSLLERSDHTTYCPYKGDCAYYRVPLVGGERSANAVWTYEAPYAAVANIKDHLAFYPDRFDIAQEPPAG